MNNASVEHFSLSPREVLAEGMIVDKHYSIDEYQDVCQAIGFGLDSDDLQIMHAAARRFPEAFGMDAYPTVQQPLTTPSTSTLVQFLQNWLPGVVKILTAARKIDAIVGISTVGSWEDEEIVQPILENTAFAVAYGDTTNVPLMNWNLNFQARTVWRGEAGLRVGVLEERRAARQRVNSGETKRESAGLGLEITRNAIGFYGYNSGNDSTYGFLNDPALPAYNEVATGALGYTWSVKTYLEITADIRTILVQLQIQSQDTIEPGKTPITLAIATAAVGYLSVTSNYGMSVWGWIKQTYGDTVRVVSAPQLNAAHAGDNVIIGFAETVDDLSSDDRRTFIQVVPSKMQTLGVQKLAKGYEEDYSNATAGVMCKRPYAVYRAYNI